MWFGTVIPQQQVVGSLAVTALGDHIGKRVAERNNEMLGGLLVTVHDNRYVHTCDGHTV